MARDARRKRDVIKKVIAYMTLGIDVSKLFSDMVMVRLRRGAGAARLRRLTPPSRRARAQASQSKDVVVKKMVFLYLVNYAKTNPELAILAVNTLDKDWCVPPFPFQPRTRSHAARPPLRACTAATRTRRCAGWRSGA